MLLNGVVNRSVGIIDPPIFTLPLGVLDEGFYSNAQRWAEPHGQEQHANTAAQGRTDSQHQKNERPLDHPFLDHA